MILLILLNLQLGDNVRQLEWVDPYGRQPTSYSEWLKQQPESQKDIVPHTVLATIKTDSLIDIIVEGKLYPYISSEVTTFCNDLVDAGYSVQVDTVTGITHDALRTYLTTLDNLMGAIFIGNLPVAWFETQGFGCIEEFPIDIYFMDLNGTWEDTDGDGIYDGHYGDVGLEIWVGRLYPNLTWDNPIKLLKTYFSKNHAYREGNLSLPGVGLAFVDDDWSYWSACGLDHVYPSVEVVNTETLTVANEYRQRLLMGYEWIHLCAHSSPWGHTFKVPPDNYSGTVFNYEIFVLEPHAHFYNLFSCSGTRYIEPNCIANWYIFQQNYGLLVVGSSKTGSMLYFDDFYSAIGAGHNIGDAFKIWFNLHGEQSRDWFYGLNLIGDPTLHPLAGTSPFKLTWYSCIDSTIFVHPESDGHPQVLASNGRIFVVWESGRSEDFGRSDVYFGYHDGTTWVGPFGVCRQLYWDYTPALGLSGDGNLVAVWASFRHRAYYYNLYYSVFDDTGWTAGVLIADDPAFDMRPSLVRDRDGLLHLFWESRRNVDANIYHTVFDGTTWTAPEPVTSSAADECAPVAVVDSSNRVWVFYTRKHGSNSEIYASYYDDGWYSIGPLSGTYFAQSPDAACDDNGIWVVFQVFGDTTTDIYYVHKVDDTWVGPYSITHDNYSDATPAIALGSSATPYVVWMSHRDGWQLIIAYYTGDWVICDPILGASPAMAPDIAIDTTGHIWVVYQGYTDNWEICVHKSPPLHVSEISIPKVNITSLITNIDMLPDTLFDLTGRRTTRHNLTSGIYYTKIGNKLHRILYIKQP